MEKDEKIINKLVRLLELDTGVDLSDLEEESLNTKQKTIKEFIEETNLDAGPYDVQSADLYKVFKQWALNKELKQIPNKTTFGRFIAKVFPRVRLARGKFYKVNKKL